MKNNLLLGVLMTLLSAFSYAVLTAIVKSQGAHVSTPIIVFIQSLVTLVLILPLIFRKGIEDGKQKISSEFVGLHFFRTIFSLGISYLLFLAVIYIPLVNGILLANTAPLIVPFIAYFFFSQKMNHRLWMPLLVGFIGVILVLQPNPKAFNPAALLALGAGVCMAASMLLVRITSKCDSTLTISFYYFLFSTIISGIVSIWFWVPLPMHTILLLLGEGVLFFIVQISLASALQNAPAEIVSSLYYSNIVFAAIIGWAIFQNELSFLTILGIILTCMGGILCILEQSRANKKALAKKMNVLEWWAREQRTLALPTLHRTRAMMQGG